MIKKRVNKDDNTSMFAWISKSARQKTVLDLMRIFSSAMRYAYQRLLEGEKRKDLKKQLLKLLT